MTTSTLKEIRVNKNDSMPAVIIPLVQYEDMKEDLDMFYSKSLVKDISIARKEIKARKTISWKEVKKKLKLS